MLKNNKKVYILYIAVFSKRGFGFMKKALIVIALVLILLCSLAVFGIPFNLVVGKEGAKEGRWEGDPQMFYSVEFLRNVFVGKVDAEAFKDWNECGGNWFAELYDSGMVISTSANNDICSYNKGALNQEGFRDCWRTADFEFTAADKIVVKTQDLRNDFNEEGCTSRTFWRNFCTSPRLYCHPRIQMQFNFIEGRKYPYAVSSKSEVISLGVISDLLGSFVFREITSASDFAVASDNPRVLVWVGGQDDHNLLDTKTSNDFGEVWACYDGDQDQKCDFAEDTVRCAGQTGDHYNDVCCGVDVPSGFVTEFNGKAVNALCGQISAGDWVWADVNNVGEIFNLNYYPGKTVVSDGSKLVSCEPGKDSVRVSTKYGSHTYLCSAGRMFECSGGRPFSTTNVAALGSDSRALSQFFCPSGMVAYWPMDDTFGNTLGNFAAGNANSVSFMSGHVGSAASFSAPNSDIYIDHPTVNLALPSLSIEAWIRPSSLAGKHVILNKEGSYELYLDGDILKASLYSDGSPASAFLAAHNPITNDVWSHVTLVYDSNNARIYHNGQGVASAQLSGRINASNSSLRIGARSYLPTEPFEGLIDEVALYSVPLSQETVQSHYSNPKSYCGVANISGVYYCASDGDWTKDLDTKDELSCNAAGFNWTGSKCCSELDDIDESYSDVSTPAASIGNIAGEKSNADLISEYAIALNSVDSFVVINGPAKISVLRSSFRSERGQTVFCEDKEVSSFGLSAGQSKRITNYNYPDSYAPCTIGRTVVSSLPTLAQGGCFKKNFYPSGSFLYEKSVINANGEFVACKQRPAGLQQYDFIRTQATPCGKPINDVFPGQAAVCLPSGNWHFIGNADDTSIAQTFWDPADFNIAAYRQGCCPNDKCWNGTGCQPADTYYAIETSGFVCK